MVPLPAWAVALSGGLIGCGVGYAARRGRLCTFGALEDVFVAGDYRRLKVLAVALATALFCVQALIVSGWLAPQSIRYLPQALPWLSMGLGGLMFGFGMALVGTCAFGSLVRLGGGDLRGLVTIIIYAVAALAIMRGGLVPFRIFVLEGQRVAMPGGVQADLVALVSWLAGVKLRLAVAGLCGLALFAWAFSRRDLFQTPRLLIAGFVLGLGVGAAWLVTGVLVDQVSLIYAPEGLGFVGPVANALQALALQSDAVWTFGTATVAGTVIGSAMASILHDEFRWEAFDDQHEMRRHIFGGVIMGLGGVMAGGCTIGQGITAGSVLALSWPVTVGGIVVGARLGLFYLMDGGSFRDMLSGR
jgi:uncharacterized membrane protein YedE/YeeE